MTASRPRAHLPGQTVTESDKRLPKAGLNNGLTCQWLDPPLFGKGRMNAF